MTPSHVGQGSKITNTGDCLNISSIMEKRVSCNISGIFKGTKWKLSGNVYGNVKLDHKTLRASRLSHGPIRRTSVTARISRRNRSANLEGDFELSQKIL